MHSLHLPHESQQPALRHLGRPVSYLRCLSHKVPHGANKTPTRCVTTRYLRLVNLKYCRKRAVVPRHEALRRRHRKLGPSFYYRP